MQTVVLPKPRYDSTRPGPALRREVRRQLLIIMYNAVGACMQLVLCEYSKFVIESNRVVTVRFDPVKQKQFEIFEYLFNRNIYKEGTVSH